jgi:multiple sugar transport system permease protein
MGPRQLLPSGPDRMARSQVCCNRRHGRNEPLTDALASSSLAFLEIGSTERCADGAVSKPGGGRMKMAASSAEFGTAVSAPAMGVVRRPRRVDRRRRRETATAYLLILPALILLVLFIIGPLFGGIALSLFNYDLLTPAKFIGLGNYRFLIHDSEALNALRVTLTFTVASVALHVIVGLVLALAANRRMPRAMSYGVRTAVFFPVLISWAVVSLIAEFTLDPNFGFITYYLDKIGISGLNLFADRHTALAAIVGVDLWHSVGFTFIVLLAGLQVIPQHLYEAARIDGASPWRMLRSITLPLLSPSLFFVIVISFIGAFQLFEPVNIITKGGPGNTTESIVQYIYEKGFVQFHIGYAATLGVLVMVTLLLATLIQFGFARRWVHNDLGD